MMTTSARTLRTADTPITILIGALGGEGGGVLAEWLVDVATEAGHVAQSTSIPGVAQRTGATIYYIEIFPVPVAALDGRRPVLSLLPVPGCIDLAITSELLEAGRIIQNGMVSVDRTLLIASTSRTLTTAEKMALGDGRFDSARLLAIARAHSRRLVAFDMEGAARDAGTVVSAVMFGAIAASGLLPFTRASYEKVIKRSGRSADASLAGFERASVIVAADSPESRPPSMAVAATTTLPSDPTLAAFPVEVRDIVALGRARLIEFQDVAYADLYLQRVAGVLGLERERDPVARHGFALTRETARFLALWMAFDDIVRVANLKCRASRFARVRREVAGRAGDVVHIVDYFKPGMPEFAALLPASWANMLLRWDRRRQARGKAPFALALHVRADTVTGFFALRTLAGLRGWRRRGFRFAAEQALIERWLDAIRQGAGWHVAFEIALCGRLIKGYGATNERGKHNMAHILEHLASGGRFADPPARAAAIRAAREAALADEAGKALDQALVRHGAPARPVVAQPIRWTRKPVSNPVHPTS